MGEIPNIDISFHPFPTSPSNTQPTDGITLTFLFFYISLILPNNLTIMTMFTKIIFSGLML